VCTYNVRVSVRPARSLPWCLWCLSLRARIRTKQLKILIQGVGLSAAGALIGILGALGTTRYLARLLYGVRPVDPPTFVVVAVLLGLVALAACYIPARRASRVDPMVALRYE
jgi:ABC-type antimicrobial peptide transport system permease subunit